MSAKRSAGKARRTARKRGCGTVAPGDAQCAKRAKLSQAAELGARRRITDATWWRGLAGRDSSGIVEEARCVFDCGSDASEGGIPSPRVSQAAFWQALEGKAESAKDDGAWALQVVWKDSKAHAEAVEEAARQEGE